MKVNGDMSSRIDLNNWLHNKAPISSSKNYLEAEKEEMCGLCLSMIYDLLLKLLQSKFRGELSAWEHSERGNVYTYSYT